MPGNTEKWSSGKKYIQRCAGTNKLSAKQALWCCQMSRWEEMYTIICVSLYKMPSAHPVHAYVHKHWIFTYFTSHSCLIFYLHLSDRSSFIILSFLFGIYVLIKIEIYFLKSYLKFLTIWQGNIIHLYLLAQSACLVFFFF